MAIQAPDSLPTDLAPIADELQRIHESALWSSQGQFEHMKVWRRTNLFLGGSAAVLAAIAGGTGLSTSHLSVFTGTVALLSAAFGATLTALNPSHRAETALGAANGFLALQTAVRQLLTIRLATITRQDALVELDALTARLNELRAMAEPPGRQAYKRAKSNIDADKGQTYEVDAA